jgi:hypothetical protein
MDVTSHLLTMAHSALSNYVIPGLTSYMIGGPLAGKSMGTARMFVNSRNHQEAISPHSHRYAFAALVIKGSVENRIWIIDNARGDEYEETLLVYQGKPGTYTREVKGRALWRAVSYSYDTGQWYGMSPSQVHSIAFSKGAVVLMLEGPNVTDESVVLDPVVDGKTIPVSTVQEWMFSRR